MTLAIIAWAVWLVGFLVTARLAYVRLDRNPYGRRTAKSNATLVGSLWPLAAAILPVVLTVCAYQRVVFRETPRQRDNRLAVERDKAIEETKRLQREFNIPG